ncbi:hypothetical protein Tco_0637545 [Tanacetum coccineum]
MEQAYLSLKGRGVGRGVKEKHDSMVVESVKESEHGNVASGSISTTRTLTDVNVGFEFLTVSEAHGTRPHNSANKENMDDVGTTTGPTSVGTTLGVSSYANVTSKPSGKKLNIRILFTLGDNGIDVVVPVEYIRAIKDVSTILVWVKLYGVSVMAFSEDSLSAIATKLGTPLRLDSYISDMCMQSWGRLSYAIVIIELRADVELKENIVVDKEYRPVPKRPTANSSGNKKKGVEPTIEVSNSNSFEVLNSVDNDEVLGTNRGTTNLVNNGATSSGSSFMNVDNSSTGTTLIINKIGKFKELLTSGQAILVDEAGNPLKKVEFSGDYDSEDEVASVDNDMAHSMALERVGFGTQSLLEQLRDSYGNGEYDDDPYDDDMYRGHDLSQKLQAICDNLDIRV